MKLVIKKYEVIITLALIILIFSFNSFNNFPAHSSAKPIVVPPSTVNDIITRFSPSLELKHKKIVALTFDDGPHPVYTERLIEALKKLDVPATFFVVGKQAEKYPLVLRKITDNGFAIGGHTYSHEHLTLFTNDESAFMTELEKTRLIIKSNTGIDTYLFRPPGGRYDGNVERFSRENGYRMVLWDVLPRDHIDGLSSQEISSRVISGVLASEGGIVLMHSGRTATIDALNDIVKELRSRGYNFVSF